MIGNEQQIRTLAHQMWEAEGKPAGQAERHWKLATRLVNEAEQKGHHHKRSVDPSEAEGPFEPEQPDQT